MRQIARATVQVHSAGTKPGDTLNDLFSPRFALARYNSDGSLDSTFGNGGLVETSFAGDANLWGLALQADGKIVATGSNGNFIMARYNSDGSLDDTPLLAADGDHPDALWHQVIAGSVLSALAGQ